MRTFIKIVIYLLIGFVLFVLGSSLYLFKMGGIEDIVNEKTEETVKEKYNLDIRFGKITGSFFSDLVIEDIEIYYDDSVNFYQLLKLPKLTTKYDISNLWDKKYNLDFLILDSAEITILKDKDGNFILPDFTPKDTGDGKEKVEIPSFAIDALQLNNVSINIVGDQDTSRFDNINLFMAFKREDNTMSVDIEKFEFTSNKRKLSLDAGGGKVTYSNKKLVFTDVKLSADQWSSKLNGFVSFESDEPTGQVKFEAYQIDFKDISKYIGPDLKGVLDLIGEVNFNGPKLDGFVNLSGDFMIADFKNLDIDFRLEDNIVYLDSVRGTVLGECQIAGVGFIDFNGQKEIYNVEADINGFNLNNLVKESFYSDLNGHMILNGESFRNIDLLLKINLDLTDSYFDEYPLQTASGNINVTTDSLSFTDWFKVTYFENMFYVNGRIDYSENINLGVIALLEDLDHYEGKLFIDKPGGRAYAEANLYGKTADPGLKGKFSSDSLWIYGLYSDSSYGFFEIDRFLTGRKGFVETYFYNGTAWPIPYDSSYARLTLDSNIVGIDSSCFTNQYVYIDSKGSYDYMAIPGKLDIDSLYINLVNQSFYNRDDILIEVDSAGFIFNQASIGFEDSRLAVNGRADYDEEMDLLLSLNQIQIQPWKNIFEDSIAVDGFLSSEASLTGSFENPKFILNATVDSLTYADLLLGNLATKLSYDSRRLNIDSLIIYSDSGSYYADGFMMMDLSFTTDKVERFPEEPMNVNITASDREFNLVTFFLPSVEEVTGDFDADFTLSGTPKQPHLEGVAFVKGYKMTDKDGKQIYIPASLKYFDLEEYIYTDSAGVTMENNLILVDTVTVFVYKNKITPVEMLNKDKKGDKKNDAYIYGSITVKTLNNFYYDIDVNIPQPFQFSYDLDDISGELMGTFHVDGDTPPLVTGTNIELVSMEYLANFAEVGEGSPILLAFTGENTWDLDIDFNILSNYWIKNIDIDAEFSGDIKLQRTSGKYSFGGEMEILRGNGYLFDKTFNIVPGGRVVFEGGDEFNPTLDMTGYTYVSGTRDDLEDSDTSERLRLGINITGTLEEPIFNVTEDSDFGSNEDIVPLLVANYAGDANVSNGIETRLGNLISTQVSQIATQTIGLETFVIDPYYRGGAFDPSQTRVTIGAYLLPNAYGYVRSNFSHQSKQEIGFEYRLNKSIMFQGLKDEDNLYHLNMKFNLEFE